MVEFLVVASCCVLAVDDLVLANFCRGQWLHGSGLSIGSLIKSLDDVDLNFVALLGHQFLDMISQ